MSDDYEWEHSAQDRWFDKNRYNNGRASDHPSVSVWMPTSVPTAHLETVAHGCDEPDTLREGPSTVRMNIGGVSFGGYLEDMELLFDAVQEQLRNVRAQYEYMREVEEGK